MRRTAAGYNYALPCRNAAMEAEQLNQIANSLAGLADRAQAMRRYL
jgi:hypothetical protein